jgi:hypothetical protein
MARPPFLAAYWSEQWKRSYAAFSAERQAACDRAVMALIKGEESAGLFVKPILPDKHYLEARFSQGDRIIFRIQDGALYFVDVVKHDDIARYGRAPKRPR